MQQPIVPSEPQKRIVAIIDDDKTTAIGFAEFLEILGYQPMIFSGPRQALFKFEREHPDLILLDVNMPGINGYDVCRYLKRESATAHIPVVISTSRSSDNDRKLALEAGASDYLVKPVSLEVLEQCLRRFLPPPVVDGISTESEKRPMSHFPIIEPTQATDPKVKAIYEEITSELGFGMVPNLFKSMATLPDFLEANWKQFRGTILHGDFPRTLKEMIGVVISQANNSQYALKVHLHGLSALGMSEEVLRTLVSDFDACPLPEREKAVISFGLKAGTKPQSLTDADYTRLHNLGLDDDEIFEIIATAHLFAGVNQYTDAINLEIDKL